MARNYQNVSCHGGEEFVAELKAVSLMLNRSMGDVVRQALESQYSDEFAKVRSFFAHNRTDTHNSELIGSRKERRAG